MTTVPQPMPGATGEVFYKGNSAIFIEDQTGDAWRLVAGHALPVSEDRVHQIAEEIGYAEASGTEDPFERVPYVWSNAGSSVPVPTVPEAAQKPVKTIHVKHTPQARQAALEALIGELCKSEDFIKGGRNGEHYLSRIFQVRFGELLGERLDPASGVDAVSVSPIMIRRDLHELGIRIDWFHRKN